MSVLWGRNWFLDASTFRGAPIKLYLFVRPYIYIKYTTAEKILIVFYSGSDKSLARPGRKQSTATEDFDVHIFYLLS